MRKNESDGKRAERFRLLTETSAGTLMGRLLRSFWQPVSLSETLATDMPRPIRIMGEDLTLYRGASGLPYLIGGRCAHRCTVLHTGHVDGEQLRCMYHGWRYDGTGQCTDMPAERRGARTDLIRIAGYPAHEYGGLIFAYMGEGAPPEFDLPRKDVLEDPKRNRFAFEELYDCNWFQQIENSLDAAHVSFAHVWGRMSRFGEEITTAAPDLTYSETSSGIRQTATRSKTNVRVSDWTFPNNNRIVVPGPDRGDPWSHLCAWAVPIDDERTIRLTIISSEPGDRRLESVFKRGFQPAAHHDGLFYARKIPDVGSTQLHSVQDYIAIKGQGTIVDRTRENLAQSDLGIAFLRRIFWRELDAIRLGRPVKRWSRLDEPVDLPVPAAVTA